MPQSSALGLIELKEIARGVSAMDAMCKASDIVVLSSGPICPGKYMIIIKGGVSEVKVAIESTAEVTKGIVYDSFSTGLLHEDIFPAVCGLGPRPEVGESVGIIETFTAATAVGAADIAAKSAGVKIVDVRLSRGMGGRAYVLVAGSVGAVQAAVSAGAELAAHDGLLVDSAVLASPHPDLLKQL